MPLSTIASWVIFLSLGSLYVFIATTNVILGWRRYVLRQENVPSIIPVVGGFLGYLGLRTSPIEHFGDFEKTLTKVLNCGGDTDTSGAIAGALAGAVVGERGIPTEWVQGIFEWPRGPKLLREIADPLAEESQQPIGGSPVRYFWPGVVLRNAVFLVVVLLHGLRRLLPPY